MATEKQQLVFTAGKYFGDSNTALHLYITDRKQALQLIESLARALWADADEPEFEFSTLLPGNLRPLEEDD